MTGFLAGLLACLSIATAAETEDAVSQSACKPGGFTVLRFGGSTEAQGKADANYRVFLDAGNYQGNGFDNAIRSAMSTWSTVGGSRWRYNFTGYTSSSPTQQDGQMFVVAGGSSFPQGVLASTLVSAIASTGEIVDSDIFFNPTMNFTTTGSPSAVDFESVALHEMGHGFGLDHNDACSGTATVMHSSIAPGVQRRSPFAPEVAGIQYLYTGSGSGGGSGGSIAVSPGALNFTATAGAADPPAQNVSLSGTAGIPWTASIASGGWLTLGATSGTTPAILSVAVRTAGLQPGSYFGRVNVMAQGSGQDLLVSLTVSAPPVTVLQSTPATLSFTAMVGETAPTPRTVALTGTVGAPWSAAAATADGKPWLQVSANSGTLPAALQISVSPTGLAAQSYAGTITVTAGAVSRQIAVSLDVSTQPVLQVDPAQISLSATAGTTLPVCASFRVAAGTAAVNWSALPGAGWIAMLPTSSRTPSSVNLCATAANLGPGDYAAAVVITGAALNSPQTITVNFSVAGMVAVREGGVVNAASFTSGAAAAPNEILSIFGSNLASQTAMASGFPLPADLGGARVLLGGVAARLLYVSPGQINLITPSQFESLAGSATVLTVFNGSRASPPARVTVARQAPGVFTLLGNGAGAGAVTHADGTLVSRAAPLAPGETVSVYLTGMGPLFPGVADGTPPPADPLARATNQVRLLVDGEPATVLYAGASPGFAGLQVVVATLPRALSRQFPEMVVQVEEAASNTFTAGGPSLLDVSPSVVPTGADSEVTLRGINLPGSARVQVGNAEIAAAPTGDGLQTLQFTIPASALGAASSLDIRVLDPQARSEPASNPVTVFIQR